MKNEWREKKETPQQKGDKNKIKYKIGMNFIFGL